MRTAPTLACLLGLALWAASARAAGTKTLHGHVIYVLAEQVYVSLGSNDGVDVDTEVEVLAGGRVIAHLQVVSVSPRASAARFEDHSRAPRPGDRVRAIVAAPATAAPPPAYLPEATPVDSGLWAAATASGFDKVHFEAEGVPALAVRPTRSSAHLRGSDWVYFDSSRGGTYQRDQVDLIVSGPVDSAGRFVVDADMTATEQAVGPTNGRYRDGRASWLDVYRAALWFRGVEGLGVGVGRLPTEGLRYGLVDGAFVDYQLGQGPTLKLAAGLRPNTESMMPALDRPTASIALAGDAFLSWGLVTYGAALSWLGRDHSRTEGAEASASLGVDLERRVWLGVEAGGVALVPESGGATRALVDRAALTSTFKLGDETTLRLAGRRLDEPSLGSDTLILPTGYLPGVVTYDALLGLDSTVAKSGPVIFDLSLAGGGVTEPGGDHDMSWASPGIVLRLPGIKALHARVAYRLEYGWVSGHLGELGVGLNPTESMSLDLMQQAGVLLTDNRHQLLTTGTTWASFSYRFLARFELSLRGRSIYGDTGRGLEAMLLVSGRDFI